VAKTFLDELPLDWTRPELRELRDLFVLAYRRPTAAEQLAESAAIVPGTFPFHPDMRSTWTELIKVMGDQGRLRPMVDAAADDPAAAAYQERFKEMLSKTPPTAPPQPVGTVDDWWKGDDAAPGMAERIFPERLMERRSRLLPVQLAEWVAAAARSVAKLSLAFGDHPAHGTGFVISDDALLTNHHNIVHEKFGAVTSVVAEFDHQVGFTGKALVRRCEVDDIVSDEADDWAVLQLEKKVDRTPLRLGTDFDVAVDDTVVIIQHPGGGFKQFALEPLAVRHFADDRIQYVADTQQGSSGSPVFNARMEVIALHHAEAEATVAVEGTPTTVWRNQGINISRVTAELSKMGISFTAHD
jgi:S1-C subfamily serine protease